MKNILLTVLALTFASTLSAWEKPRLAAQATNQSNLVEVQSMDQLKKEISSGGKVFVDFYSTTCPPCKKLAPLYAKYSVELASKGKFLKVNAYNVKGAIDAYGIKAFPTVIVFENGKESTRLVGMPTIPEYFEKMK